MEVIFGFSMLRDIFEEVLDAKELSIESSTATQWIFFAGEKIYKIDNTQIDEHWVHGLARESELWTGALGFNRARWEFWRSIFEELSKEDAVTSKANALTREAVKRMEGISENQPEHR